MSPTFATVSAARASDPDADPFLSKRVYVSSRLQRADVDLVVAAARRFLEDFDDPDLAALVQGHRPEGDQRTVKNLICSTRKPDLIVTDALSNDLALVNADEALLYDGDIPDERPQLAGPRHLRAALRSRHRPDCGGPELACPSPEKPVQRRRRSPVPCLRREEWHLRIRPAGARAPGVFAL